MTTTADQQRLQSIALGAPDPCVSALRHKITHDTLGLGQKRVKFSAPIG
jgi:hypothetical protein